MQSTKKAGSVAPKPKTAPILAEVGLVLMDSSFNIFAFDWGAGTILNYRIPPGSKPGTVPSLPEEIMELIRNSPSAERSSAKAHLRLGKIGYVCRTYLLESPDENAQPIIALHLERDLSANDAICDIVNKYHLTTREQEVLRGISQGLATKELAERMSISPNTVKAFIRLVMIKMGVMTRAGIVAKILHNGGPHDDLPTMSNAAPRGKKRAV